MNHPIAEIFSQGEEVINGQVADTNGAWLSQNLIAMGFTIARHTAVGDQLADLIGLLNEISQRADLCICTGGLGPTIDDLTAEAVALAFNCPLQLDPVALAQIKAHFVRRKRSMADTNRKQAFFPQGAIRIDNDWGTAPGFALKHARCWFLFFPGVPTEMKNMFNAHIKKELAQRFDLQVDKLVTIKSIGIGESDLQQTFNDIMLPAQVKLGFRASTDDVQTKLLFPADTSDIDIKSCVDLVLKKMGEAVYAVDTSQQSASNLVSVIDQLMNAENRTLSVLETATQGLIAAKCVGCDWLVDSMYKQSRRSLLAWLKVEADDDLLKLAVTIGQQLKQTASSDLILIQLYQGDKNQFQDKAQSIVLYNALITPDGAYQNTIAVGGSIQRKQNQAAIRALDLLRRYLQQCH